MKRATANRWRAGVLLALAAAIGANAQTVHTSTEPERGVEQQLLRLTNRERANAGLPELKEDERLTAAARAHSLKMAAQHVLSHRLPDEPELKARVDDAGVSFDSAAENVSVTDAADAATSAHAGLMASPGHRANILGRESNAIGVGVVRVGATYWITEDFAHTFPKMTAAAIERSLMEQVAALRQRKGLRELNRVRLAQPERACRDDVSPRTLVASLPDARDAIVFTTWTLDPLPQPVVAAATQREREALAIQVCPLEAGQFKVVAIFF
jgi:uncharacterized protein YkwD